MKGIILAAGRGSRLGSLTDDRPKCLVELAGRSLLDWQRAALEAGGLDDIAVVRGYRGEAFAATGLRTIDNPRWAETNMVRSLLCAQDLLRTETCLVSYADIVYHPDIIRALTETPSAIAVAYDKWWSLLWARRFSDPLSDAETFRLDGSRLKSIGQRAASVDEIEGQYMGLLRFTPRGWAAVERIVDAMDAEDVDRLDMTSLLQRLLMDGVDITAVPIEGRWCEVDSGTDLALYREIIEKVDQGRSTWAHDWRWQ